MLDEKHTTRNGSSMLIAEMENDHLVNTFRFLVSKAREVYDMCHATHPAQSEYQKRLYGRRREINEETGAMLITTVLKDLYPYMAEVLFRIRDIQMDEVNWSKLSGTLDTLAVILERNGYVPEIVTGSQFLRLAERNDENIYWGFDLEGDK
jgi:hypothetical protein